MHDFILKKMSNSAGSIQPPMNSKADSSVRERKKECGSVANKNIFNLDLKGFIKQFDKACYPLKNNLAFCLCFEIDGEENGKSGNCRINGPKIENDSILRQFTCQFALSPFFLLSTSFQEMEKRSTFLQQKGGIKMRRSISSYFLLNF